MKTCAGKQCHQGRKPCRCGTPDLPSVPLFIPLAIGIFVAFSLLVVVASL